MLTGMTMGLLDLVEANVDEFSLDSQRYFDEDAGSEELRTKG
jgi:hypothetical protein